MDGETVSHSAFEVFRPSPEHGAEAAALFRASIIRLCVRDHRNDPDILRAWTENKTPEHMASVFADPSTSWHVVRHRPSGALAGVGELGPDGRIVAVYVHPDAVRQGVGRLLLATLEREAAATGQRVVTLESTATGRAFYRAHGYEDIGPPQDCFGVPAQPMRKVLA